ncbi:hypothetical protein [Psychrilyobacter sp.]|uniref:hypothetical protein n=1 Tax=Psychrilyobacter sp. TaxID=2586924 RepID=UPI00301AC3CE
MTPAILEDKMKEFLEDLLKDTTLKNQNGDYVPINVFLGDIPPKNIMSDIFPYVFLKTLGGEDEIEKSTTELKIVIGTTSTSGKNDSMEDKLLENQTAHRDLLHMIQKIRSKILKVRVIGGFPFQFPFKYKFLEEDINPLFIAVLNVNFGMVQPEFEMNY